MYLKYRTVIYLFALLLLLALVPALAGCSSDRTENGPPTADTVAVGATPDVKVITNPTDIEEVKPNEEVIISLEASGTNLRYVWKAAKGTLSSSDGVTAIYTAPENSGRDSVDITITSDNGSTTRTVHFNVVTPEPTDVPTETVEPTEPVPTATTQPEASPSMPLRLDGFEDGQIVDCENLLRGTYSEEFEEPIWPIVVIGGRWYPQAEKPALKINGTWSQIVQFGTCNAPDSDPSSGSGQVFQLLIVKGIDPCHSLFVEYMRNAAATGDWSGILDGDIPQECKDNNIPVAIFVTRD